MERIVDDDNSPWTSWAWKIEEKVTNANGNFNFNYTSHANTIYLNGSLALVNAYQRDALVNGEADFMFLNIGITLKTGQHYSYVIELTPN